MLDLEIAYPDGPGDVRALHAWLRGLSVTDIEKLVILGKTEGPATLNDFSRDLAQAATDAEISASRSDLLARSFRLFSTGCEGIASPITLMLASGGSASGQASGLVIGMARSEPVALEERCGLAHVDAATQTVKRAMADAALQPDQVKLVLVKSPVRMPGVSTPNRHSGSTGSSRGAAALGAGVALGEVDRAALSSDPVLRDVAFANRVMAFSGTETDRIEVLVFGERAGGDPRWSMVTAPIMDVLDTDGFSRVKSLAGAEPELVLFKTGIAADGRIRGRRTTVLTSDLSADKQLRAAASGLIAAHFGKANAFISGGAEHQAAPGGCLCSAIVRRG